MFTGLVRDIGIVQSVQRKDDDINLVIKTSLPFDSYTQGASVLCSGICLTVTNADVGHFSAMASHETVQKTNIGAWVDGHRINLEGSLRLGDELGGHLVYGHVDAQAKLLNIRQDGESWRLTFEVPKDLSRYFAPKGSVTLDGVSLTVNEVQKNTFGVNIIPYTWGHTTLSDRKIGDFLNLEIDMLARYVVRALEGQEA